MDMFLEVMREVGELTGDASVGRGVITTVAAGASALAVGWRLLRGKPDRIRYTLDAPAGTRATIKLNEDK